MLEAKTSEETKQNNNANDLEESEEYLSVFDILNNEKSSDDTKYDKESKCSIFVDISLSCVFLFIYLADIYSDITLAVYFYINIHPSTAYVMISIIYISSLMTTIYERRTRTRNGNMYFVKAFLVFLFNLSGILLYKDILVILLKKLITADKKLPTNPLLNNSLNKKKRNLAFLKIIESYTEAFPQMFFQIFAIVDSIKKEQPISVLQYFTFSTSFTGFSSTAVIFVNSVTPDEPQLTICTKTLKYLWLLLVSVSKLTSLYLLVFINQSVYGFMALFCIHIPIGRQIYLHRNFNSLSGTRQPSKKDFVSATVFGIVFVVTPYLYTGKKDFYALDAMIFGHSLHLLEVILVTFIWAWHQENLKQLVPVLYYLFIVISLGGYILGLFCFIVFKYIINKRQVTVYILFPKLNKYTYIYSIIICTIFPNILKQLKPNFKRSF